MKRSKRLARIKRRAAAIRAAERETDSRIKAMVNAPHRCGDCPTMIPASEQYCVPCKQQRIGSSPPLKNQPIYTVRCRSCGASVMPGENYCYSCIGD